MITDAGSAMIERAMVAWETVEEEVLGPLGPAERETLHGRLVKALGEGRTL